MDSSSTQTIASFVGILLRREHIPGQRFVQLVFREGDQNWLCVSSRLTNVKLAVGQTYKIEGVFKQTSSRSYIYEPKVAPLRRAPNTSGAVRGGNHKKAWVIASAALASVLLVGGIAFALHSSGNGQQLSAANASTHTAQQYAADTNSATATTDQASQTTPTQSTPTPTQSAATPAATTTAKKTTTVHTTAPASVPTTATTAPVATTPVSTAYCDAPVAIAVTSTDVPDATDPPGTVLTSGSPGSQQTCYSDAAGDNPVTAILTPMVPATVAVAPPASN